MIYREIKIITEAWYIPKFLLESRLFSVIFTRKNEEEFTKWINESENFKILCHVRIHQLQARSMKLKWLEFYALYIWYLTKNLINSNFKWDFSIRMTPFEIEAYDYEKFYLNESSWKSIDTNYSKLIEVYNLKQNHG